jgi:peptidoglycan hydrolase-like protein with peptidoglycan-binding domain
MARAFSYYHSNISYYRLEDTVYPSPEVHTKVQDRTDVMLVQFLLAKYYAWPLAKYRSEFMRLHTLAIQRGKRWDDGIYGDRTQQAVRLFEDEAYEKMKDGIFYPGDVDFVQEDVDYNNSLLKIDKLNWVFDRMMNSDMEAKNRIVRLTANPVLAERIIIHRAG